MSDQRPLTSDAFLNGSQPGVETPSHDPAAGGLSSTPALHAAAFPDDALPPACRRLVLEASDAFGCDPGFVVGPCLSVMAAAVGLSMRAVVKRTWVEPAAVNTGLLAYTGSMKSPVFDAATEPMRQLQAEAARRYRDDLQMSDELRAEWSKKNKAERGDEPDTPAMADVILSDFTVESVAAAALSHPRGLLILRDELSAVLGGVGRYGKGRAEGDAAALLELHRAGPLKRNRAGSPTIYIPQVIGSISGTTQPSTFSRLLSAGGIDQVSNGMMGRFLWAWPTPPSDEWTDDDVSDVAAGNWSRLVSAMYTLPLQGTPAEPIPADVKLAPAALEVLKDWQGEIAEERKRLMGEDAPAADAMLAAWAKLRGAAVRLALVHHAAGVAEGDADSPSRMESGSMVAGVQMARWYGAEASRIYGRAAESPEQEAMRKLAQYVAGRGGRLTAADLANSGPRRYRSDPQSAEDDLQALADAGYGSFGYGDARPGRPSEVFILNAASGVKTPRHDPANGGLSSSDDISGEDRRSERPPSPRAKPSVSGGCSCWTTNPPDTMHQSKCDCGWC